MHRFHAAWLLTLCLMPGLLLAANFQVADVRQNSPGNVVVTVRASAERLDPKDFELQLSDGVTPAVIGAQSVSAARAIPASNATSVILCIDRSGSMRQALEPAKEALRDVLATPRPDLSIAVMSFASDISPLSAFSTDLRAVQQLVGNIRVDTSRDGKTRLYDAIGAALSSLDRISVAGPKRLIVISDGMDDGSTAGIDEIVALARARSEPLDTIGWGAQSQQGIAAMQNLAAGTGGRFVRAADNAQLAEAIRARLGTSQAAAFDVHFAYAPHAERRVASQAALVYKPAGTDQTVVRLTVSLAAVNTPSPPPSQKPWWRDLKFVLKIALSGLLAVALTMVVARRIIVHKITPEEHTVVPPPPVRTPTRIGAYFPAPGPGQPTALLVGDGPRGQVTRFPIDKAVTEVGADSQNDLHLPNDEYVSRRHARIRFEAGSLYLTDLGSSNGTFRNGVRLADGAVTLSPGDAIRFGHSTFEVQEPGGPHGDQTPRAERATRT